MTRRPTWLWLVAVAVACLLPSAAGAQGSDKLGLVVPHLFGTSGLTVDSDARLPTGETHSGHFNNAFQSNFTQFNTALASQLTSVPLPSPAGGFTYTFDASLGTFKRTTESFGPILAERSETLGKKKFAFGVSYQSFSFDTIEGMDLEAIPAVFTHDNPVAGTGRDDLVTTVNSIRASTSQFTAFLTYGLSDHIDVSFALPIVDAELSAVSEATVRRIGTSSNTLVHYFRDANGERGSTQQFRSSGSATGIGDVLVRVKASAVRGLAVGADVRLPTGDEENLLGSGTLGVRPFLALSHSAKAGQRMLAPHLNVGYQWNGDSVVAGDIALGVKGNLPDQITYSAGFDFGLNKQLTLAVDLLGRTVIDSQRLSPVTFRALNGTSTFDDIQFEQASFSVLDGAVGLKVNGGGNFLLDFNLLFKLNDAGLRDKVVPMVGGEFSF
jgi:hypothetical protein